MAISKADILQGRDRIENVHIEGFTEPFPIRPLTDGQYSQIEQIRMSGMKIKGNPKKTDETEMEFDLETSARNRHRADVKAVFYGLATEEKWTEEEIESIRPPGTIEKLAAEVYRISGVDSAETIEEIESFRKKSTGA